MRHLSDTRCIRHHFHKNGIPLRSRRLPSYPPLHGKNPPSPPPPLSKSSTSTSSHRRAHTIEVAGPPSHVAKAGIHRISTPLELSMAKTSNSLCDTDQIPAAYAITFHNKRNPTLKPLKAVLSSPTHQRPSISTLLAQIIIINISSSSQRMPDKSPDLGAVSQQQSFGSTGALNGYDLKFPIQDPSNTQSMRHHTRS